MASDFDNLCGDSLAPGLLQQFQESVTYTQDGTPTTVNAIVRRETLEEAGPDGLRLEYAVSIEVARNDLATVKVGDDTAGLKKRIGDAANTTYKITRILSQDGGMWLLGLN